jgi:NitT/TauT family transport system substrate-binding protein
MVAAIAVVVVIVIAILTAMVPVAPREVRVGYIPAASYALVWVAYEKGYFEEEGLKVVLKGYANVAELATAISKGEIEGAPLTAPAAALFAEKGRYIIVGGNSVGGTALVCKPENAGKYRVAADLDGVKLASVRYVPGDTVIRYVLAEEDISIKLTLCLSSTDALTACKKDMVDVAILWEPFVSLAEREGMAVVFWDKDLYDAPYPCCLQVFMEDFVRENPDTIVRYLKAMIKAERFCKENPEKAAALSYKYMPTVPREIIYRSVFWEDPDLGRARNPLDMNLHPEYLKKYTNMMVELGMISKRDAAAFLARIDPSYLQKAQAA